MKTEASHVPVLKEFFELGGGTNAHEVVVPTASASSHYRRPLVADYARKSRVRNVTILHTYDRKKADTKAL